MRLAPIQERPHVPRIGPARVRIADAGGEEFQEAKGRALQKSQPR